MIPERRDYQKDFDEYWEPILIDRNGTLNEEQIKKELSDFIGLMEQVAVVDAEVTDGKISSPTVMAFEVIAIVNERLAAMYEKGYLNGEVAASTRAWEDDGGMGHHKH